MRFRLSPFLLAGGSLVTVLLMTIPSALAEDIEGRIESLNPNNQSFVVEGITFYTTNATDYDGGLQRFADLAPGQRVEVDFQYRNGKHFATEVERDD